MRPIKKNIGSSMCAAISYALTDKPIGNIKKDNLVNKINEKEMVVTVEFQKDDKHYKIIRGRKPNILKLFINGKDYDDQEFQQGEVHDTQEEISNIIGMSHDLLNMIMIMNGTDIPFAQKKLSDQRSLIEELLRITQLSEKAEAIKDHSKNLAKKIEMEEFKNKTILDMNHKTISQLDRLEKMSIRWNNEHKQQIDDMTELLSQLSEVDIEHELSLHELIEEVVKIDKEINRLKDINKKLSKDKNALQLKIDKKQSHLNIAVEDKKCYACGQSIDDEHADMIVTVKEDIEKLLEEMKTIDAEIAGITLKIEEQNSMISDIPDIDNTFYSTKKEAWVHEETIKTTMNQLETELTKQNPYDEQITNVRNETMQEVDSTIVEKLIKEKEHYDFLHKVLTGKDSFVRKRIIDQSIRFLNARLKYYVEEIGLPHKVRFENDMNISIEKMGKMYDYDNLSRGQKTRLNLALSFSFRDVFENLHYPINTLIVDEVIDNGLDVAGVETSINIMKNMSRELKKCVYLITHKEDAKPKVNNTLTIIYEGGFSSILNQ
jgi:DNA repair exonuclease SbcCD ATPase subunit